MSHEYEIDDLDRKILNELQVDARKPFLEIARKLIVSGGTIHQRVNRMQEIGVIQGFDVKLNEEKLGIGVVVLLGVHLKSAKGNKGVVEKLKKFPEVLDVYFTTGSYALIAKIGVATIKDFHDLLSSQIQSIENIQSTESFICLDQPIRRPIQI